MSEKLTQETLAGIYEYCQYVITNEELKSKILDHFQNVFENWPDSWIIIKQWLLETEFLNKEQVLKNFIEKIPDLQVFQDVIEVFINRDPPFWETVYNNLFECQLLLKTE